MMSIILIIILISSLFREFPKFASIESQSSYELAKESTPSFTIDSNNSKGLFFEVFYLGNNCSVLEEDNKIWVEIYEELGYNYKRIDLECNGEERDVLKFEIPNEAQKMIADKNNREFYIDFPMREMCIKSGGNALFYFYW
jgi:hypothetical protein